jgi:hypothetical protein
VGDVVGFALRWDGQAHGALWVTGDTVLYDGLRRAAGGLDVGTVLAHLGAVRFPVTGPVRYSMAGGDLVELARLTRPRTLVPVHYEGWSHFSEGRAAAEAALAGAPEDVRRALVWTSPGVPVDIDA